jgi:XTP/dITP diphosphohydrolase
MQVTFITGNKTKWEIAQRVFSEYKIDLTQKKIETAEIQDTDVLNVAEFSAKYASNELKKPVIKNDVGYYIPSLNNFPGPFTKFANTWFNSEQILSLLKDSTDRSLIIKDCISYCEPGKEPVSFIYESKCLVSKHQEGNGGSFDNIIIREGQNKIQSLYTSEEMLEYWADHLDHYRKMCEFIVKDSKRYK